VGQSSSCSSHSHFFVQNKRQVYLLYKKHTTLVSKLIQGAIDEVAAHNCLLGVLNGLAVLHQAHIIHGVIKTENILLDSEGNGILAEYDFTKSVVRIKQVFNCKPQRRYLDFEIYLPVARILFVLSLGSKTYPKVKLHVSICCNVLTYMYMYMYMYLHIHVWSPHRIDNIG
jgi:serine/threonine protein kinase